LNLEKKKEITDELRGKFSRSEIVILTDYKGLNVAAVTELRRKLRDAGVDFKVVKNTLLRRAAEGTAAEPLRDSFTGPSAVAMSYKDPVAPAKVLTEFAKSNDRLEIRGGAMAGRLLSVEDIKALSALPSREALLGQVLSVMNAVPTSFVRVLSGIPQKFLYLLQAVREQKEAQ
jgi:large subunit ribosomal protein L10